MINGRSKVAFHKVTCFFTIFITAVNIVIVVAENCGQEDLARCAKPLQVLSSTSEMSTASKKEDLEKLCPDLYGGLHCIRSYTRRCMSLQQRDHFNKLYHGTNLVIRDLCREGQYQEEFLRHAPCLKNIKLEYGKCTERYQDTMTTINQSTHAAKILSNFTEPIRKDVGVGIICCSFREYLDCSEKITRRTCGQETAIFTRGFLDKMSSSLIKEYCEDYTYASGKCSSYLLSSSSMINNLLFKLITPFYLFLLIIFR